MKRDAFVAGAFAATIAPRLAVARSRIAIADLVDRIPGITGVVARTISEGPPAIAIRARERFAAASVIKLAIMATVFRAIDAGTARLSDVIHTRASDLIGGSDVLAGSAPGQGWSIRTLLDAMIRESDNSAANTLISAFGMATINATMRRAGMTSSRLGRHFADVVPAWEVSRNVVTPHDVAALLYEIERGSREGLTTIATPKSCRQMLDIMLGNEDPTKIVRGLPPGTPCAHKTGEIDGVRNDAAVVDPFGDAPFILVVLTRELSDVEAGNDGIAAIARRVDRIFSRSA